jgi:hypothetical protein
VVLLFAALTYALIRVIERRGVARPVVRRKPKAPPKFVAPDDDEDFLRDLERKRRHPDDPDAPTG